jgi:hypothetical protein
MTYSESDWAEKRKNGLLRYLLIDGILFAGGPFAVVMQAVGYFILRDDGQSFGEYFTLTRTWVTFFLHGTLFGLVIGYLNWRRREHEFAEKENKV